MKKKNVIVAKPYDFAKEDAAIPMAKRRRFGFLPNMIAMHEENRRHNMEVNASHGRLVPFPNEARKTGRIVYGISKARAAHLEALKAVPFFHELMKNRETIRVGGQDFTLFRRGFLDYDKVDKVHRRIVVLLDGMGSGVTFYKSSGVNSKKPSKWLPFSGIVTFGRGAKWRIIRFQKLPGHPNFSPKVERLGEEIAAREQNIDFDALKETHPLEAVLRYL